MGILNNISQDFYNIVNNFGTNPFVLVVLIAIILIYYILFSFLGSSTSGDTSSGSFVFLEALLWGLFILLIFVNGLSYFFGVNIFTDYKNLFSHKISLSFHI